MHNSFREYSQSALVRENIAIAATVVTPALSGNEVQGLTVRLYEALLNSYANVTLR